MVHEEFIRMVLQYKLDTFGPTESLLTVSKSSEYKSFKVLDFDDPPNI